MTKEFGITGNDREPETQPLLTLVSMSLQSLKLLEYFDLVLLGNAGAGIQHLDLRPVWPAPDAEQHATAWGVLQGIGNKILQDTGNKCLV